MRILHTSDWHIGKKLEDRVRLSEQKAVLSSLVDIVRSKRVDVVIVAGDVFDTFTPSAEAESVFYDVLSDLSALGVVTIVISGNHDDPTRLTASKNLTASKGVIFSDGEKFGDVKNFGKVKALRGDKNYVVIEDGAGERVYFAMLPYPTEARMKEAVNDEESYEDKIKRYIAEATADNEENYPCVLAAHVFMLGGVGGASERQIELGGARMVPKSAIPKNVVYTALGHLHKRQVVDKERNIIYSGSILQNAFDECGYIKSVTVFDIKGGKVENLEVIELEGYLKLLKISASSFEEAMDLLCLSGDTFVELTLSLNEPPSAEAIKELVTRYPKAILRTKITAGGKVVESKKLMSDEQLFVNFYRAQYGADPDDKVVALFLKLINDLDGGETL